MRSTRNLLLLLLASFLLCTAFYFGFKSYNIRKQVEVPQNESAHVDLTTLDKPASKAETAHVSIIQPPELFQHLPEESSKSETKIGEDLVVYSEEETDIDIVEGTLLLKSFLKDMTCVMGEISPYSVSCCGIIDFAEDSSDEKHGCILIDTYNEIGLDKPKYRLRFIIERELVIYEEVIDFPKPARKCYSLSIKPGVDICASINHSYLDNDVSDELGYETCTFMKFGYDHNLPNQLLGYSETVNCNIQKELLVKKGKNTQLALILRLKLKSPIEVVSEEVANPSYQSEDKTGGAIEVEQLKDDTEAFIKDYSQEVIVPTEESVEHREDLQTKGVDDRNPSGLYEEAEENYKDFGSELIDGLHTVLINVPFTSTDSTLPIEYELFSGSQEAEDNISESYIDSYVDTDSSNNNKPSSPFLFDFFGSVYDSIQHFFSMITQSFKM